MLELGNACQRTGAASVGFPVKWFAAGQGMLRWAVAYRTRDAPVRWVAAATSGGATHVFRFPK
jgi:hypothetical protein